MDEEIELQQYLQAVIRHWKLVLAITLVIALVAVGISFISPLLYEASVALLAQPVKYEWRLEPSIQQAVDTRKDWKREYLALFERLDLASEVAEAVGDVLPANERSLAAIHEAVSVHSGVEGIFYIEAQSSGAEAAAALANAWAEAFMRRVGELYGPAADLEDFQAQLEDAATEFEAAQQALEDFRHRSGLGLQQTSGLVLEGYFSALEKRLEGKNDLLAEHQNGLDALRLLIQEAEALRQRDGEIRDLPLELLAADVIQARGQVTVDSVLAQEDWDAVLALLRREEQVLADATTSLQAEVLALQQEMAALDAEQTRLLLQHTLARNTYSALAAKVAEIKIQAGVGEGGVQILSPARPPTQRPLLRRALNVVVAAVLGLVIGILAAFAVSVVQQRRGHVQIKAEG